MRTHPIYVNICPVKDRQEVRTWWTWRRARAPRVGPTPTGLLWPRAGRPCGGSERWRREAVGSAPQSGYELSGQGGHIQKFCTFRDNLPIDVVLYKHDSQKGAPDVVLIRCIQCHAVELVCDDVTWQLPTRWHWTHPFKTTSQRPRPVSINSLLSFTKNSL